MITLVATALVVSLGVIALLSGATVALARRALSRSDQRGELRVQLAETSAVIETHKTARASLEWTVFAKEAQIAREIAARKVVEEQRDDALQNLADHGDPDGIAAAIRSDLDRLRDLAEKELPEMPSGASGDRGDGSAAVHGATEGRDRPDGG